ncbi:hypothetical protein SAMN03159341_104183 [Paenibacillus sp. 1_12]|uniref:hypothetical protein n=1 Tax=Paenibacillus sp. 1_12 TaxID=1566278 RepID=UPI0008ED2987|nr:hypothetical protein [Paenibacillus sp. 1_12]SFL23714.1 hypothetical protein SAMN03159341_104183 [Paenibacillus sp. 1_12]
MWKKLSMIIMGFIIVFSFSAVNVADAAKSYKGPKKSINLDKTPNQNSGVNKADPSTATKTPNATTNPSTAAKPGFFSGGLMKGLLIGGLAGMLFGGLLGDLGGLGNILGMLVNVLAIAALVTGVIKIVQYFRNKRKLENDPNRS